MWHVPQGSGVFLFVVQKMESQVGQSSKMALAGPSLCWVQSMMANWLSWEPKNKTPDRILT